jgi:hypothetical protein
LVFNNQFLDGLGLVKVMLFDLMKHHFDYKVFPGISYTIPTETAPEDVQYQKNCIETVKELDETLRDFQVKLSAAYARLRIERGASGASFKEQMDNILPIEVKVKEDMAGMNKFM